MLIQTERCRIRGSVCVHHAYFLMTRCKFGKLKATTVTLYRRARDRAVRAEHATVARKRLQALAATFAVVEELAGISRHRFNGPMAAFGTSQCGFSLHYDTCLAPGVPRLAAALSASLRTLPATLYLLKTPFRALPGIARELGRELDDSRFNRPVQQIQLLEPLEAALKIAALNQPLDRIDRAVLTAHPNKDGRIISPLLGQLDTLADEGLQRRTSSPFGSHPGSIQQRAARRDPEEVGFQTETLPRVR